MITRHELTQRQTEALAYFQRAGAFITPAEQLRIEIADFGLSDFAHSGLGLLVYVNTARCCAKDLILWPRQTCPEHKHPSLGGTPGKEETFRCRWGKVYLYVEGPPAPQPSCRPPPDRAATYTVWHEIALSPGEQYTIQPDTLHWFQAGELGAVVSEFSTHSADEHDIFTDPAIGRATKIA
ncbi:hypothetical protein K0B96_09540 [Horticoccus luteus]|uniref:D-lyxose ketol-isomerase n=1 Tax=Horticoccus luteus TaxID=2862869 RepID=A0A8F9TT02_9BACT|nr:hypothetical protein [Horticoccus luteus]QYM77570.1 hypothetical protein K0B96_09540 [Horticoccus luteus]